MTCFSNLRAVTALLDYCFIVFPLVHECYIQWRGRRGRDRVVVGFTTTCAISDYHN